MKQRWPWCSRNLGGQMANAIQRPKEQTSFDRKEGKAESTCLNERGSHPTSPHPQASLASAQRVPHMYLERSYFPVDIPPVPEWLGSCDVSTEPFIHQQWRGSTPQSFALAWSMRAQCGAEDPQDVSNAYKTHLLKDTHCHSLLLRRGLNTTH